MFLVKRFCSKQILHEKIMLYHKYGENINHINFLENNALFAHNDPDIIESLLRCNINIFHKNVLGNTAEIFHLEKKI